MIGRANTFDLHLEVDLNDLVAISTAAQKRRYSGADLPVAGGNDLGRLLAEICRGWLEMVAEEGSRP